MLPQGSGMEILMKKTISMIYRFIFILFSVWGICQKVGFNILSFSPRILNFTIFVDFFSFVCLLAVFIIGITHSPGRILMGIKAMLTLLSALVFWKNIPIIASGITYDWILGILLPIMMCVDWLLFDEKGTFSLLDPLLWLIGALLLGFGIGALLKNLFGIDDFWNVLGMFKNKKEFTDLLKAAVGAGLAMFLLDCIISAFGKKSTKNALALIYRLIFIALECYALLNAAGSDLTDFLYNMKYFHILSNFLCLVCICVVVVYNLIKFRSLKKRSTPFPRLKGAFTVLAVLVMLCRIIFGTGIFYLSVSQAIIYFIAPVMMIFDWVIFEYKGSYRIYDPLLWAVIPALYVIYAALIINIPSSEIYNLFDKPLYEVFIYTVGTALAVGYVLYIFDKLFSKRS